ncbi:hypothetical protein [Streptomyces sp. NPDC014733]|uniref:hypothetical protein n=1 Tax=Streptomyces sp. NPDC014733 TaxID=3364885 RepID=UPI0036F5AC7D
MKTSLLQRVATALVDHGISDDTRCGRIPDVPPAMAQTVRDILNSEGGAESSDVSCLLHPEHAADQHISLLADLGATGRGAWTLWRGPTLLLVLLPWCTALDDEPCPLFDGHPGKCPPLHPS